MRLLRTVSLLAVMAVALAACSSSESNDETAAAPTEDVAAETDDGHEGQEEEGQETQAPVTEPTETDPEPSDPPEATEETTPEENPDDSPSPSPTPEGDEAQGGLPPEWQEDSSGDGVPDFVMAELGWDLEEPWCDLSTEIGCPDVGPAGSIGRPGERAVMLMLDSSGSMMDELSDGNKMDMAKDVVQYAAVAMPPTTDMGFLVFGHEGSMDPADQEESCVGVDVLADLGDANHETISSMLDEFSPTGFTPLTLALDTAGETFADREGQDNRVLLVSDGLETCDGDPVAQAAALHESGIELIVDVIAYDVPQEEQDALGEIAEAGGGQFRIADTGEELYDAVTAFLEEGYARAHCVLDAAVERMDCVDQHEEELGQALGAALEDGGYNEDEQRAIYDHVNDLVDDYEAEREQLGEALTAEYCMLYEPTQDLMQRVEGVYGDEPDEEYEHIGERLDQFIEREDGDLEQRLAETGRPRCEG